MPKRKSVRLESSSTDAQEETEETANQPETAEREEKEQSSRRRGKTRFGRTVKKPKLLGHNVMVSAIQKTKGK